ncbi:hypothetical protein E4T42_02711 [Aureobasidium subglaciale]|nr:hypothetical protein E4T42_02711 [Aureobasidium subglaciale]
MSSALRIARAARPLVANPQVARFSIASRRMAAGDAGSPRSGGAASGDAFSRREEAAENLYVKRQEAEKLEALRQKVKAGEAQLAKDKADLEKHDKNFLILGTFGKFCQLFHATKYKSCGVAQVTQLPMPDYQAGLWSIMHGMLCARTRSLNLYAALSEMDPSARLAVYHVSKTHTFSMPLIEPPMPPLETIFKSFAGTWKLCRSLTSALPGFPSGTFTGTATFKPHNAFGASSLLYHETGELVTEQGYKLLANRKYIYRFSPDDEKISIWFVKEPAPEGGEEVDYLFHELEFSLLEERWIAKGDHLCEKDMYWAFYDFRMEDSMKKWGLRYKVKGPQKDYLSDSAYERIA